MVGQLGPIFGVSNIVIPNKGPKVAPVTLDFTSLTEQTIEGELSIAQQHLEYIQGCYIDNSAYDDAITITVEISRQVIVIPGRTQGYIPFLAPNPPRVTVETTAAAGKYLLFLFYNVPIQAMLWASNAAGGFSGLTDAQLRAAPVDVSQPIGGAYTDRSIAALSGASEALMAANANRRFLIIQNISANPIAINLTGGAAALNTEGSIELEAGGSITLDNYPPTSAINIIGTVADKVTAMEG